MIYNRLTKFDFEISKIGLGTVQFGLDYGFSKAKTQLEVDGILDHCQKNGINFLDTARAYGDSEEKIGKYLLNHPDQHFVIATKLEKINVSMLENEKRLVDFVLSSVQQSLKNLNLKSLDFLLLHQTEDVIVRNDKFWNAIALLKSKGLIKLFGLSVYDENMTMDLVNLYADLIDLIQVPYNLFDQRFRELFGVLKSKNIDVISRSTFLKGVIPCNGDELPDELKEMVKYKELLSSFASDFQLSVSEVALLFVLQEQGIHSTILGVDSIEELQKNINVFKCLDKISPSEGRFKEFAIEDRFLTDPRKWIQLV